MEDLIKRTIEEQHFALSSDLKRTSDEIKSTILSLQKNKTDISDFEKLNSSYVKLNVKLEDVNDQLQSLSARISVVEKINWQPEIDRLKL